MKTCTERNILELQLTLEEKGNNSSGSICPLPNKESVWLEKPWSQRGGSEPTRINEEEGRPDVTASV